MVRVGVEPERELRDHKSEAREGSQLRRSPEALSVPNNTLQTDGGHNRRVFNSEGSCLPVARLSVSVRRGS